MSEAEAHSFRLRAWRGRLDGGFFRGCIMGSTRNIVIVMAVVLSACAAEQRESLTPRALESAGERCVVQRNMNASGPAAKEVAIGPA